MYALLVEFDPLHDCTISFNLLRIVVSLCREWLESDQDKTTRVLHTQYHYVEKNTNALSIKW